jgi:hypothetical protein
LEQEKLNTNVLVAPISTIVNAGELPAELMQSPAMQRMVKFVRTDLDKFSNVEIDTIYQHGYEVAARTILPALEKEIKREDIPKQQRYSLLLKQSSWNPVRWIPSAQTRETNDFMDRVRQLGVRISKGSSADIEVQGSDPDKLDEMKRAGKRKLRLWDSQDPFSWVFVALFLALIFSISSVVAYNIFTTSAS